MLTANSIGSKRVILFLFLSLFISVNVFSQQSRSTVDFDAGWRFNLGDAPGAENLAANDAGWRMLNLPHDWSVEGEFSKENPATPEGGALPGGIGWYRKTFTVPATSKGKQVYIDFDGVYQKSDVWINGHHLGFRPNGYISFRYELTPYLNYGGKNVIAVKVDNSAQPNSRWYSGSGIYRNVWLVTTGRLAIDHWGTYVTTPDVNNESALIDINTTIKNTSKYNYVSDFKVAVRLKLRTTIYDTNGQIVSSAENDANIDAVEGTNKSYDQKIYIKKPKLWSVNNPYLYKIVTKLYSLDINDKKHLEDEYTTPLGIRYFNFDADKGFSLNGKHLKILGVCDHHDLGSLGAAVNIRALQRQLEILKEMGCNAIRTSHNPPVPELLDLCDKMGFIVMDEAFDCWEWEKKKYDYHLFF
jgi:beta-galactosidase